MSEQGGSCIDPRRGLAGVYHGWRSLLVAALLATACASRLAPPGPGGLPSAAPSSARVLPIDDVEWGHLNPARGDASPRAATLWGDRNAAGPAGFVVRFADGFASPPHVHNVAYRGVVLKGLVHNDDPQANALWMPPGSYWTQPLGATHVTAASGGDTLAYVEIDQGPYLVHPVSEATATGQHPVNVHADNVVWIGFGELGWGEARESAIDAKGEVAFLWGESNRDEPRGLFLRLSPGAAMVLGKTGAAFHLVVVEGRAAYGSAPALAPGSYVRSHGGRAQVSCRDDLACIFYVRTEGRFQAALVE